MKIVLFISMFLSGIAIAEVATLPENFAVLASGESHGMVEPCDCPVSPGGGVAIRQETIAAFRDSLAILLVDAGGFCGGGIYDPYTQGRASDSSRSIEMIKAMAAMKYDGVAVGDDDLQYGAHWLAQAAQGAGLPLISANCFTVSGKPVFAQMRVVRIGGSRIVITALTTPERLFDLDPTITIAPPIASLKRIWQQIVDSSDYQIILSHLGEEESRRVLDSFPKAIMVVNGHRKTGIDPAVFLKNSVLMEFGYLSKTLTIARMDSIGRPRSVKWVEMERVFSKPESKSSVKNKPAIPIDKDDKGLSKTGQKKPVVDSTVTVVDLYIMSQCPYGKEALGEFTGFIERFPKVQWNVWFIGTIDGDSAFSSLHGESEVKDEKIMLAVKEIYPDRWFEFLKMCASSGRPVLELCSTLKLDSVALNNWIISNGKNALAMHYRRSMRLAVEASPTLLWNNQPVEIGITRKSLAKRICTETGLLSKNCDSLPECFEDRDCTKPDKEGHCIDPATDGKCLFVNPVVFNFTVVIPDSSLYHPENATIATTRQLFSATIIKTVRASSSAGKKILQLYGTPGLPFYLFDKNLAKAYNFSSIESGLDNLGQYYSFKKGIMPPTFFYKRPRTDKTIMLIIDPLFPDGAKIIQTLGNFLGERPAYTVKPVFYDSLTNKNISVEERIRQEESNRWLALEQWKPQIFRQYLKSSKRISGSSYWFSVLPELGVDINQLMQQVQQNGALQNSWEKQLMELEVSSPVQVLLNNQELVVIKNQAQLEDLIAKISR